MRSLVVALSFACLLLLSEQSGLAQPISFRANQVTTLPSTLGDEIGSLLQGDFNGDGKPDVVVVALNEILVYPGVGEGLVGAPIVTPISPVLSYITAVAGDFNGDGIEDLVLLQEVYATNESQIVTMLGNGDGTFRVGVVTSIPLVAIYLETADFNNDGIPDISWILRSPNEDVMEVQLGIGNGAFEAPRHVPLPAFVSEYTIGDFNGDGKIDLAAVEGGDSGPKFIQVLLGNGAGSFPEHETVPVNLGPNLNLMAAGDLNADRYADLVLSTSTGFAVLLGTADGRFSALQQYTLGLNGYPAIADVNGDGYPDVVLYAAGYPEGVVYALGNGDGTFQAAISTYQPVSQFAVTGDFNHDGIADVAAVQPFADLQLTVLLGSRSGLITPPVLPLPITPYSGPVAADFNADGNLDFAVVTTNGIAVFLGNGHGNWTQSDLLPGIPNGIAVGDFNGDGIPDIVESPLGNTVKPGTILVHVGNGDGTFSGPVSSTGPPGAGFPVTGDFNADGKLDIAVTSDPGYNPRHASIAVMLGNGDGSFSKPAYYPFGYVPGEPVVADFNGDGVLDLAFTSVGQGVSVLSGKGDGTFLPPITVGHTDNTPESIQAEDVNGDGRPDLIVAALSTVDVFLNQGNDQFALSSTNAPSAYRLLVADLNGDGVPDLVSSDLYSVAVQLGNGDGTFRSPFLYGLSAGQMAAGRFYGGSLPDIAMTCQGGVGFLVNNTCLRSCVEGP
jgi:hypothetical protein